MRKRLISMLLLAACGGEDLEERATESSEILPAFTLASSGCPMAHCDFAMSDRVRMPAPLGPMVVRWIDTAASGANIGIGCASNGSIAACALGGTAAPGPYLKVYDANGLLWSSSILDSTAFTS